MNTGQEYDLSKKRMTSLPLGVSVQPSTAEQFRLNAFFSTDIEISCAVASVDGESRLGRISCFSINSFEETAKYIYMSLCIHKGGGEK